MRLHTRSHMNTHIRSHINAHVLGYSDAKIRSYMKIRVHIAIQKSSTSIEANSRIAIFRISNWLRKFRNSIQRTPSRSDEALLIRM